MPALADSRSVEIQARRSRTAKASRISRYAVKSRCACEWGGWGRLSVDGPGQHNPDRSEGPWSRVVYAARMAVLDRAGGLRHRAEDPCCRGEARRMEANLDRATGMLGASLTETRSGQALSDMPALEPYWGKPAVRNLRGDDGNVGIIRSPVRAIVLPDLPPRASGCLQLHDIARSSTRSVL
jgi:hypothetical protein